MGITIEKMDNYKVRINFNADAETFEKGMQFSYNKNKTRIHMQGFRKGKAPRKLIEIQYGKEIFYDDAINHILPEVYANAVIESGLDVVSRPDIDVEDINLEEGVSFSAIVTIKPEITVSDYKGITYKKFNEEVTEDEINAKIEKDREQNARELTITDRPIQDKDIVVIDYKGFVDGEAFEGGTAQDYELVIGSKTFIDTFEDQLIGHNVADDVTVNVRFPDEYHVDSLAGKDAKFEVEIKEIRFIELPEVNDEFVSDISEFDTLDEYKKDILASLSKQKQEESKADKENQVIKALIEKTDFDVPEIMIENQIDNAIQSFENYIKRQGMTLEMYLQYMGQTKESLREVYRAQSEEQVRGKLCLESVSRLENIEIAEDELNNEIERIANEYKLNQEDFRQMINEEEEQNLKNDLKLQKAMEILLQNAVCIEE